MHSPEGVTDQGKGLGGASHGPGGAQPPLRAWTLPGRGVEAEVRALSMPPVESFWTKMLLWW